MPSDSDTRRSEPMLRRALRLIRSGGSAPRFLVADLSSPQGVILSDWTGSGTSPTLECVAFVSVEASKDAKAGEFPSPDTGSPLEAALLEAVGRLEANGRDVIAILPEDLAQKKVVDLPSVSRRLRRRLIRARAQQFSGIRDADLVVDARALERSDPSEPGKEKSLVIAASRAECLRYVSCLRRVGLRPIRVSTSQAAALVAFEAHRSRGADSSEDSVVGLYVDDCSAVIALFHHEQIPLVRALRLDPNEDPDNARELLMGEVRRSVLFSAKDGQESTVQAILVLDATTKLRGLVGAAPRDEMRVAETLSLVRLGPKVSVDGDAARRLTLSIGAAIAEASVGRFALPDLLPVEARPRQLRVAIQVATIGGLGLVALILYKSNVDLDVTLASKRAIRFEYERELKAIDPVIKRINQWNRKKEFLEALDHAIAAAQPKRYAWSSLVRDLSMIPPGESRLTEIRIGRRSEERYDPDRGIVPRERWTASAEGVAGKDIPSAQEMANQYAIALRQSKYIEKVSLTPLVGPGMAPRAPGSPVPFTLECELH